MFHRQSSNSIKQLKSGNKILGPTYGHLLEWKTQQDRRSSLTSIHFVEELPSWSPTERKIMDATSTSHDSIWSLKFPSNIKELKSKLLSWQFTSFYNNNFEMVAGHVVSRMIFRQLKLTEMLASEHWTDGSAENRFFPSNRPPKFRQNRDTEPTGWIATS